MKFWHKSVDIWLVWARHVCVSSFSVKLTNDLLYHILTHTTHTAAYSGSYSGYEACIHPYHENTLISPRCGRSVKSAYAECKQMVSQECGNEIRDAAAALNFCLCRHIGLCDKEIIRPLEVGKQKVVILILSVDNPNHTHHQ